MESSSVPGLHFSDYRVKHSLEVNAEPDGSGPVKLSAHPYFKQS
jgi:hypothetical protein